MATFLFRLFAYLLIVCAAPIGLASPADEPAAHKHRIFIVSSYAPSSLRSQSAHAGIAAAMLRYRYLDNETQARTFASSDDVETSHVVVKKAWMDTTRHDSVKEIAEITMRIMAEIDEFQPDLVLLGDDNATNYIGNQLLDTEIPVVFWGITGLPIKYGLVDSMDRPGHNVTGVWQGGYYKEGLELLHQLVPEARTFAVLSCDSVTARPKVKQIEALDRRGELPLRLVATVQTNNYEQFQQQALQLAQRVDAFFVLNHDTMRDAQGNHVEMLTVGRWYLSNIRKPEVSHEDLFVREGMLLTANDSGFNQAYTAFEMAYDILEQGFNPGLMRTKTPAHGPRMINRNRAEALGIQLNEKIDGVDIIVEQALALR